MEQQPNKESQRIIAQFMTASAPLESFLQQGGPLTRLQLQSISNTVDALKLFLDTWKRKHGEEVSPLQGDFFKGAGG